MDGVTPRRPCAAAWRRLEGFARPRRHRPALGRRIRRLVHRRCALCFARVRCPPSAAVPAFAGPSASRTIAAQPPGQTARGSSCSPACQRCANRLCCAALTGLALARIRPAIAADDDPANAHADQVRRRALHRAGSAAVPQPGQARQARDHADQAADHPARPVARLFAGRGRAGARHRAGPAASPTTTPTRATWSPSSPTARRSWASAISARWRPSR